MRNVKVRFFAPLTAEIQRKNLANGRRLRIELYEGVELLGRGHICAMPPGR